MNSLFTPWMSVITRFFLLSFLSGLTWTILQTTNTEDLNGVRSSVYDIQFWECNLLNLSSIIFWSFDLTGYIYEVILTSLFYQFSFNEIDIHLFSDKLTTLPVSCHNKGNLVTTLVIWVTVLLSLYIMMLNLTCVSWSLGQVSDIDKSLFTTNEIISGSVR